MSEQGQGPEDFLLERLNEAASGDAAVRQLRRRYDLLRHDYEQLLDRLGELEDRLNEAATQTARPPAGWKALLRDSRGNTEPRLPRRRPRRRSPKKRLPLRLPFRPAPTRCRSM